MTPYYDHAGIVIYCGDCREILPHLPKVDCVITDPPYGIGSTSHRPLSRWYGYDISGNNDTSMRDFLIAWNMGPMLMFDSARHDAPEGTRCTLIWDKGGSVGFNGDNTLPWKSTYEPIRVVGSPFIGGRIHESVLHYPASGFSRPMHPHEKPVDLLLHLVACTQGTILDPFMGSGTTLVAAKNLGRKAIGIEICREYCDIAIRRLEQEVLPFGEGNQFQERQGDSQLRLVQEVFNFDAA